MSQSVKTSTHSDHTVQFYEDEAFLCEEVGRFLGAGLGQDEAALVIASEKQRRGIAAALGASGLDVDGARARGQLLELDAEEALHRFTEGSLRHGLPDEASFHRVVGGLVAKLRDDRRFAGLRAYGNMMDLLIERGNTAATVKLESLWNELCRDHPFHLFCGYSMRHFRRSEDTGVFQRICDEHLHVFPSEAFDERWPGHEQRRRVAELQQRAGSLEEEIADRKNLERALREEQERLRDASRRKDEFIALLSHELRNPLAPILTSLDIMDVRGDVSSRREREIIRRQARHLATLVEDLLDVSRVTSGKISLQKRPVEFITIADTALEMTSPLFEERGHVLDVSIPAEGLRLDADPVRLPQVLANLLANAAKYTPPQGRVSLTARREGAEIVATVEDNGIGIPRETLSEIFAPFSQARQSLDRAGGGLGLGLTLVRSITQLHGGSVSAESEGQGKGSRFILRLPAARIPAVAPRKAGPAGRVLRGRGLGPAPDRLHGAVPGRDAARAGAEAPRLSRVLVVDDNRDAAIALAHLIGQLGYEVRTAHDGADAMTVAQEFGPDVALVDIGLPTMDGYAIGTRLRRLRDGAPLRLIAVTGYGQASDRAKSILAGFDHHVVKPLDLAQLRSLLSATPNPSLG